MAGMLDQFLESLRQFAAQRDAAGGQPAWGPGMPAMPAAVPGEETGFDDALLAEEARAAAAARLGKRRLLPVMNGVLPRAAVPSDDPPMDAAAVAEARRLSALPLDGRRPMPDNLGDFPAATNAPTLADGAPMPATGILGQAGMPGMTPGVGFQSPYDESDPAAAAQAAREAAAATTRRSAFRSGPFTGATNSPMPFAGMLSPAGLLNAPGGGAEAGADVPLPQPRPDLPPSTNDPMAYEPQVMTDGVPLPRPRPISPASIPLPRPRPMDSAPLSMAGDEQTAPATLDLTGTVASAQGTGPADPGMWSAPLSMAGADPAAIPAAARPAGPASAAGGAPEAGGPSIMGGIKGFLNSVTNPSNAGTLIALGSGLAGAPSFGTGMRRGFAAAAPAVAAQQASALKKDGIAATYRALIGRGVPAAEALAAVYNPDVMKATAAKYFETKPLVPHEIGTDRFGNKIMGTFNPNTGKYSNTAGQEITAGGAGAPNTGPQDGGGLSGDAYLKTLPDKAYADKIKAIAEGREPFPQGQIMRSPYGRKLGEDVLAYDPTFDAVNYKSRESTRKDFTSGKSAQNLTAFNTAIGHLGSLNESIERLENSNFPYWNKIANAVSGSYDPKFQAAAKQFQAARTAVADELTRAFRGSGGNVHDIKAWEATINQADSPAALRSAVKQAAELLGSRIDAVGDQYNRGMGTTKDPLALLTPKAAAAFKSMHEQDPQVGPGKRAPDAPATLKPGASTVINGVTIKRLN